ncbi:MAG: hypothetical protein ACKVIN_04355 [Longimicrobiales bacterium]
MNHDDRSAAEREASREYDPCYDDVRIGRVTETMSDFPSDHGTVVVVVDDREWVAMVFSWDARGERARLEVVGILGS